MANEICKPETLKEFPLFKLLPTEIQWMIWKFTLPITMIRVGETRCPVIEIPQPPEGHPCGSTPDLEDVPIYPPGIVALKVCRQSRMIALQNLVPLSRPFTSPSHIICSYISIHDIIDVSILTLLEEHRVLKDDTHGPIGRLARIERSIGMRAWLADAFQINREKFLYDMGSRRLCMVIRTRATPNVYPHDPALQDGFAIRSSSLEEWVFGSRITIGHVPRFLRHSFEHGPVAWKKYNCTTLIGGTRYNRRYDIAGLCSRPDEILYSWVWLMHQLAYAPHLSLPLLNASPDLVPVLQVFVNIMDGNRCPSCKRAILSRIKQCYPELPLDRVDLIFRIERSGAGVTQE